jgi:hypothetical protein
MCFPLGCVRDLWKCRTYWLTDAEIEMSDKLVEMTGKDTYEIVGMAIQSMYHRLINEMNLSRL